MPSFSTLSAGRGISGLFSQKPHASPPFSDPTLAGGDSDNALNKRSYKPINPQKLGIDPKHHEMFTKVNMAVIEYMYGPAFDASHDYEHIQRMVSLAFKIYEAHKDDRWARDINKTVMYIACMVHDVGDAKYHVRKQGDNRDQEDIIRDLLKTNSCIDPRVYSHIAYIAARVSFSREMSEPDEIKEGVTTCPALRIVQDADRLEGLGSIGIGRCFVFGGINEERRKDTIHTGVELHFGRFQKYLELMKTDKGKEMAKARLGFMEKFREHWFEETDCSLVL